MLMKIGSLIFFYEGLATGTTNRRAAHAGHSSVFRAPMRIRSHLGKILQHQHRRFVLFFIDPPGRSTLYMYIKRQEMVSQIGSPFPPQLLSSHLLVYTLTQNCWFFSPVSGTSLQMQSAWRYDQQLRNGKPMSEGPCRYRQW